MPFHDLNVPSTGDSASLSQTLHFLYELGYSTVAISIQITGKLPPIPAPVSLPRNTPSNPNLVPLNITLLTRLTLTVSDPSQNHRLPSLSQAYNLVALRPTTEKAFGLCCTSLECDIISLDLSSRLPFILKFKTVSAALQRGIRFEINYSPGISGGNDARRNLIGGAQALIRATRGGRGLIVSSEARTALGLRGPWDVVNLCAVWGLGQERGKEALCEEAGKIVRLAGMKRTNFRGVIDIVQGEIVTFEKPAEDIETVEEATMAEQRMGKDHNTGKEAADLVSSGVKRKASTSSTTATPMEKNDVGKPLSKREMKKQAKKAKVDPKSDTTTNQDLKQANGFPFKHEIYAKKKG